MPVPLSCGHRCRAGTDAGSVPAPSAPPAGRLGTELRPRRGRPSRAPCRCHCRAGSDAGSVAEPSTVPAPMRRERARPVRPPAGWRTVPSPVPLPCRRRCRERARPRPHRRRGGPGAGQGAVPLWAIERAPCPCRCRAGRRRQERARPHPAVVRQIWVALAVDGAPSPARGHRARAADVRAVMPERLRPVRTPGGVTLALPERRPRRGRPSNVPVQLSVRAAMPGACPPPSAHPPGSPWRCQNAVPVAGRST